ncbi:hypothetical protein [Mycoplasmopsis agassizii]|uniref:Uncharacterized protein n=1 Tax=Mycoplasmopsis agassizii TaxID=33922 RepID=A0ABX4H5L1_9BACT|nr:hypothetical protein [Mycoplasmopsis agassizii]PAF55181.1 hypothetical protein CJF60_00645 [Mycoplasmopsis agassizii]SMC19807.1 hypothetical protein SAMN02745179_00950 [Mycoplasmopsis agassizii]
MKTNIDQKIKKFTPKKYNETIRTRKVDYNLWEGDVKEEFSSDRKKIRIVSEVFGEFREPEEKLPIDVDGGGKTGGGGNKPGNGDEPEWKKYADLIASQLRDEMASRDQKFDQYGKRLDALENKVDQILEILEILKNKK